MIKRKPTKKTYNNLWKKKELSILQSWEWGDVKSPKWYPERFIIEDVPVTILTRNIPLINKRFGYIPRGFSDSTLSSALLFDLDKIVGELDLTHLMLDAFVSEDIAHRELFDEVGYKVLGKTYQPNQTNLIDLNQEQEDIWMNMKSNNRRSIKNSKKRGCEIERFSNGNTQVVERFYNILEYVFTRTDYKMPGVDYFKDIFKLFSQQDNADIYLVTHDGEDVAATFITYDERGAYEFYSGTSKKGLELEAGYLQKWEAILQAKKRGKEFYDHWGVSPYDEDGKYDKEHPLYHISRFKKWFGGDNVQYLPQMGLVKNEIIYKVFSFITNIRR